MNTNIELVNHVKKAYAENWGYCLGTFGQTLTMNLLNQKMKQGNGVGSYNTRHKAYLTKFMGNKVSDCYGLVKGFLWTDRTGNIRYNSAQDKNADTAYSSAREKGPISKMPEIPGLVLHMKGHAGVYIGNGEFIECAGAPKGMQKGKIQNGKITQGNKFTHWFKDTNITYNIAPKPVEDELVEAVQVLVKAGIIGSPEYWLKATGNERALILKMAKYVKEGKA